jgi:SNF2 family DNA or RNA helicase
MSTTSILTQALRLRQFAAAYGELIVDPKDATQEMTFDDIGTEFDKLDAHVRLSEPSSKLDALEDVLLELGDQPVVVFADSRQLIDLAFARFVDKVPCAKITGPIATKEREVAVENFQDGLVRIMFATVGAGGEGITLTAASTAVFLQRPWSLVQSKQAEDRLHRIGQDAENVLYIDLVTADTVEERVFEALMEKGEMLEDLVRDKENLQRWLK